MKLLKVEGDTALLFAGKNAVSLGRYLYLAWMGGAALGLRYFIRYPVVHVKQTRNTLSEMIVTIMENTNKLRPPPPFVHQPVKDRYRARGGGCGHAKKKISCGALKIEHNM